MSHRQHKTIFAPATPQGRSAVQIIRISGPEAKTVMAKMCGHVPPPRMARLADITDHAGNPLDKAIVLFFPAPHSATGEDVAEFHLHGSPALMRLTMKALAAFDNVTPAGAGEFTRRAFLNGRIDLTRAEAIGDIIDADAALQHRAALAQLDGKLFAATENWREQLIDLSSRLEAVMDFADEELPACLEDTIAKSLAALGAEMRAAITNAEAGIANRDGIEVAIIGRPNAGKSTLLNTLAGQERAIVSPIAGTTRDIVRIAMDIGGVAVHIADTAGVYDAENKRKIGKVEEEGITRALTTAAGARIILLLIEANEKDPMAVFDAIRGDLRQITAKTPKIIPILSKYDILKDSTAIPHQWPSHGVLKISARTGLGMAEFDIAFARAIADITENKGETAILTRARHVEAVTTAADALERAINLSPATSAELMAEELRAAATSLGRITGKVDVEDLLDRIFASFCIGK